MWKLSLFSHLLAQRKRALCRIDCRILSRVVNRPILYAAASQKMSSSSVALGGDMRLQQVNPAAFPLDILCCFMNNHSETTIVFIPYVR